MLKLNIWGFTKNRIKTNNISFPSINGKVDSKLVRAMEALPEEGMSIIPHDAEMGCMKKDDKIIIYPHNPKELLFTMDHIAMESYDQ